MMNNSQQTKESQDQVPFTVDAKTFRQFCELLNAPAKDSLKEEQYSLWLSDPLALYGVENAKFAPGYRPPAAQTKK